MAPSVAMTEAKKLLDAGRLSAAIDQIAQEVKLRPTEVSSRIFLFELLCFAGEWHRAEKQLDVIGDQSAQNQLGVQVYRNNIKAECDRRSLFSNGLQPHFLSEPPAYVDLHLAAINRLREGKAHEARELLDQAEEERPGLKGKLDGEEFLDFRDYNDLTGSIIELIVHDKYSWLPLEQIKRMEIAAPRQLRDLLWARARIESHDGTVGEVFVSTLYPGSSDDPRDEVRLGRMTDWKQANEDLYVALGLRQFLVNGQEKPIFEVRVVEFDYQVQGQSATP
jgi:type VI secretion system protein ImpE